MLFHFEFDEILKIKEELEHSNFNNIYRFNSNKLNDMVHIVSFVNSHLLSKNYEISFIKEKIAMLRNLVIQRLLNKNDKFLIVAIDCEIEEFIENYKKGEIPREKNLFDTILKNCYRLGSRLFILKD